jgi:hypothetical protein
MSYPMVVPDRQRPPVVTAAGYLLYLVAGLLAVNIIVSIATFSTSLDWVDTHYANDVNHDVYVTAAKIGVAAGIGIDVVLVALFVVLAIFDLRGRNGMRITTWVIAGLGALCLGCGTFGNLTGTAFQQSASGSRQATINVRDILPGWAVNVSTTSSVISMVALIMVIILLATPASNAFFRPPAMMIMYPGYPGYQAGGIYPVSGYPVEPPYPTYPQFPPGPPPGGSVPPA